jgi:hypothetical protein
LTIDIVTDVKAPHKDDRPLPNPLSYMRLRRSHSAKHEAIQAKVDEPIEFDDAKLCCNVPSLWWIKKIAAACAKARGM